MFNLLINGRRHALDVDGDMPLLWALRDKLGNTDPKFGCGAALCGVCTVYIDGEPSRSCSVSVKDVGDKAVVTSSGLTGKTVTAVRAAWISQDVIQCGYCQPAQVMAAVALLESNTAPTDEDIDTAMTGYLCRCGTYARIRAAIKSAAKSLAGAEPPKPAAAKSGAA